MMQSLTQLERGRLLATLASFVLVGTVVTGIIGGGGFQAWRGYVLAICLAVQMAFHMAVTSNWRGIVDQHLQRERERLQGSGYQVQPEAMQQRQQSLQRTSRILAILYSAMLVFLLVFIFSYAGG